MFSRNSLIPFILASPDILKAYVKLCCSGSPSTISCKSLGISLMNLPVSILPVSENIWLLLIMIYSRCFLSFFDPKLRFKTWAIDLVMVDSVVTRILCLIFAGRSCKTSFFSPSTWFSYRGRSGAHRCWRLRCNLCTKDCPLDYSTSMHRHKNQWQCRDESSWSNCKFPKAET